MLVCENPPCPWSALRPDPFLPQFHGEPLRFTDAFHLERDSIHRLLQVIQNLAGRTPVGLVVVPGPSRDPSNEIDAGDQQNYVQGGVKHFTARRSEPGAKQVDEREDREKYESEFRTS